MSRVRRIYAPRGARVEVAESGVPCALDGVAVDAIREEWVVEDRWWSALPLRRHYYELALADGRNATVFRDARSGRWHSQPA